jgi:hypothetical protein
LWSDWNAYVAQLPPVNDDGSGVGDWVDKLPVVVEIPNVPLQLAGYRRAGEIDLGVRP